MLSIIEPRSVSCQQLNRRDLLQVGGAGLLGLSLPKLLAAEAAAETGPTSLGGVKLGRAKSVIFLFLFGGPSQLETFDLKPSAPSNIRGPFLPIHSRTPDLMISEHLHRLANVSDKFCVVRTMTHDFNDHSGGGHYIQTGHRWHIPIGGGFSATPKDWPSMGSVTEYVRQHSQHDPRRTFPAYAVLPNRLGKLESGGQYIRPGEYSGWLGQSYNPLTTMIEKQSSTDNPYWRDCSDEELTFELQGQASEKILRLERIEGRLSLLQQLDNARRKFEGSGAVANLDRFRQRAMGLVTSTAAREALDIRREPAAIRDRYGRHLFGQSTLMARRLVEAGVRFVTVHYETVDGYSWDSHQHSSDVQHKLLPTFDQACATLIQDLDERGMLDETLVVAMGEMGRTPVANTSWGRGHWSAVFPALLAGGGVSGGTVYGRTDKHASKIEEHPVTPEDLAATIYSALGINPQMQVPDLSSRPIPINEGGRAVKEIFG
jgi:hypothetical protein